MTLRRTLRRKRKRRKTRKTKKGGAAAADEHAREDTAIKELLEFHNLQPSVDVKADINNIYNKLKPTSKQKLQFAYTILMEDRRINELAQQINSGNGIGKLNSSKSKIQTKTHRDLMGMIEDIGLNTEKGVSKGSGNFSEGPIRLQPIPEENKN